MRIMSLLLIDYFGGFLIETARGFTGDFCICSLNLLKEFENNFGRIEANE